MDFRTADKWGDGLILVGVLLLALAAKAPIESVHTQIVCGVIGVVLSTAGIVIKVCFRRCPHCHELLPLRWELPRFCPQCGEKLEK